MARLQDLPQGMRSHLTDLPCPVFATQPWVRGPSLRDRKVAIISTAGLHRRTDRPFASGAGDYRIIPGDTARGDLVMTHLSQNFDRTGFQQDWNVAFPLDRLRELAAEGKIGGVADYHYSFMGATGPEQMQAVTGELARLLHGDAVDAVLLVPI
ncbi:MAG: glycine/sarcosine/betaine reductase selenoprotein B family protein [bacterium]|nr:glycine/sarcosine/betaine reductase selenoprotein B family protein [bacterium]